MTVTRLATRLPPARSKRSYGLTGDQLGWRGPWGTTYASNLRLLVKHMSADQFVNLARSEVRPPMPWFNLRAMTDPDVKAIYAYLKHLGTAGQLAPQYVPADKTPAGPFLCSSPSRPSK